ncbi:putative Exonuclease 1 [Daphnia magna]|uniref:Exonuclease 1 n=1 Tax=Daphnia magna TaxID=35525 RepID=A0A0P5E400_9CRUS|nr:putative Exonuclease 1 [Daphnia magna]
MGISGLLPFLKKSSVNCNVQQFKGKTVAIDAYCWLHKGAFCCADKLVKGEKTDMYVTYCMKFINMLISHDIKPILVFDGQPLPSKLGTELKRRENRERNKIQAREYLRQGNNSKARECFQKCVDVTSTMALELMKVCRARNIDCIVAPYEADAQLAYLAVQGIAHLIITEDSDLLAFGCPRVLFKMDQNGSGVLIEKDKLFLSLGGRAEFFNDEKFRRMCILSGCDYLPSLKGIGLGKAFKFFSGSTNSDINSLLCQVPGCLKMPTLEITREYREEFIKAEQTFLYQLIYDPQQRKLIPLTPYPPNLDPLSLPFAGQYIKDDVAFQLAIGNLDAETLERLDSYDPDAMVEKRNRSFFTKHVSIWSKNFIVVQQKSSSSVEVKSANSHTLTVCKQVTAKVEFRIPKTAEQVPSITDKELTNQYTKTESPTSPVLAARKRKRSNENVSPSQNERKWLIESSLRLDLSQDDVSSGKLNDLPSILDPFAEPIMAKAVSENAAITPSRKSNPFVKLKPPTSSITTSPHTSPTASHFSALHTFSQLRKIDANGQEIVTSAYFQSEKVNVTDKLKSHILSSDNHIAMPVAITEAVCQPFKPVVGKQNSSSPKTDSLLVIEDTKKECAITKTPLSGFRVSGLSRRVTKTSSKTGVTNGMKQLDLRSMFAPKP